VIWNIETADVIGEFGKLKAAGATVVQEPYAAGSFVTRFIFGPTLKLLCPRSDRI
jgi:hypothetical protein